ncbi:MAG: hypothetical protein NVS1B7_6010 [Candidatus Saccharimonadales bacterium]
MNEKGSEYHALRMGLAMSVSIIGATSIMFALEQRKVSHNTRQFLPLDQQLRIPSTESTTTGNLAEQLPTTTTTTEQPIIQTPTPQVTETTNETPANVVIAGTNKEPASTTSGSFIGNFVITCYALRGTTASGAPVGPGSIAADTNVLRFGTHLTMPGYEGTVQDTGSAIKGNRLDIWMSTNDDCMQWGVRNLPVYRNEG